MDRAGGYLALQALMANARDFDDVLIAMAGEADAQRILELERKAGGDK